MKCTQRHRRLHVWRHAWMMDSAHLPFSVDTRSFQLTPYDTHIQTDTPDSNALREHTEPANLTKMPPYGRGGAGNYEAVQRENEKVSQDLEANQGAADSATSSYLPPDIAEKGEAQYAHTGRGGAGNYYSPQDLSKTGNFDGAETSHILGDGTPAPSESVRPTAAPAFDGMLTAVGGPTPKTGRGGAGNYDFGINEAERKAARQHQESDVKQQRLKEDVEKGVKEQLAFPSKAKLPGGEPF